MYDYNPDEGPNGDGLEMPLVEGTTVQIYGEPDDDGFYIGENSDGQRGLIPSNFVEPIEDGAEDYADDFEAESASSVSTTRKPETNGTAAAAAAAGAGNGAIANDDDDDADDTERDAAAGGSELVRYFIAAYDYDPATQSPNENPDEEMPLKEGQVRRGEG